jgi:hypothetical protein
VAVQRNDAVQGFAEAPGAFHALCFTGNATKPLAFSA